MFKVEEIDDQIIRIQPEDSHVTKDMWQEYQRLQLELLENSDKRLYILSDFSNMESFDTKITSEVGTAKHLSHPNLGLIVLLGGSTLGNFIIMLTEHRASKQEKNDVLRVHKDYNRALEALRHHRDIQRESDESNTDSDNDTSEK
jgi:hypothetical protein